MGMTTDELVLLLTSRILMITAIRSELASLRHLARWRISFSSLAYAKRRIICLSQPIDIHAFSHNSITISHIFMEFICHIRHTRCRGLVPNKHFKSNVRED